MKEPDAAAADFKDVWDYADPEGSERRFGALLGDLPVEADASYRLVLMTQVARAIGLQRRFDEAHALLDQVAADLDGAREVAQIRYLLERGRVFNSSGTPDTASPMFVEAWERAVDASHDFHAVDAAHMVAIAEKGAESLAWNNRAIEYAEASSDPTARGWLPSLYNNIGWAHHDAGRFDAALDMFERAVDVRTQEDDPAALRIARWSVARCLRSLGENQRSLAIQLELLAEGTAAGEPDPYVHEELGELYAAVDRLDEGRPHFRLAHAELSNDPWLVAGEPERLERMRAMGTD